MIIVSIITFAFLPRLALILSAVDILTPREKPGFHLGPLGVRHSHVDFGLLLQGLRGTMEP
jgi:hypothetical protein